MSTEKRPYVPVPREGCPERCQGHYAPCEHVTGVVACPACIAARRESGPILCAESGPSSTQPGVSRDE